MTLRANYRKLRVKVTKAVEDGATLPCGAEVVYTPGHTAGHICLYLRDSRTLIAGDVLNVTDGALLPTPAFLVADPQALKATLLKLSGYDINTAVCYHGGVFSGDVSRRIKELAGT